MNITDGCEKKCPDCPLADYIYGELAENEVQRDEALGAVDFVMQVEVETDELGFSPTFHRRAEAVGIELPSIPSIQPKQEREASMARIAEKSEDYFRLVDDRDALLVRMLREAQLRCKTGPVEKKRYILFGKKVVMCGGQTVATSSQVRAIDNSTSV